MKDWGAVLRLTILLWAVACVYCLCQAEKEQVYEPFYEPVEETVEEPVKVVTTNIINEMPDDRIEEPDDEVDLTKLKQIENATLTHYCICKKCCGKTPEHPAYGITASGRKAEPYVSVAVDPFLIELGSKVYIDYGDGEIHEYRADDTGSAIAGAKIDLCVADHQEALDRGVKTVRVWWEED